MHVFAFRTKAGLLVLELISSCFCIFSIGCNVRLSVAVPSTAPTDLSLK